MMRLLFVISFVLISSSVFSQKLDAKISKKKAYVGDQIEITYTVVTDKDDDIAFKPEDQEIKVQSDDGGQLNSYATTFEITEPFNDSSYISKGKKHWIGKYTVMVWDSGAFIVPGPKIRLGDRDLNFKRLKIYVDFVPKSGNMDMYDIRENYVDLPPVDNPLIAFVKSYWWLLSLIVVAIFGFIFWNQLRKKKQPVRIVKAMSLKDRTLKAIDALENEKMWEKGSLKQHYIELSYILRSYLTARYDISLLEKTTLQTKQLLLQKGLNDDTVDTIVVILSQSDMVKFAKSQPEEIEILKISTLARQIVAETSPLEFDNYE